MKRNRPNSMPDRIVTPRKCSTAFCIKRFLLPALSALLVLPGMLNVQAAEEVNEPEPQVHIEGSASDMGADCPGCPEMVAIPGGRFTMGSPKSYLTKSFKPERRKPELSEDGSGPFYPSISPTVSETPIHWVRIQSFAIGKYEVTWDEWELCVSEGGCKRAGPAAVGGDKGWGKGRRPVINVSWQDAQDYVRWLSKKTGKVYRLPSEAEWEYAARAGTITHFSWGDEIPVCDPAARNGAQFGRCQPHQTRPVGSFQSNDFGLFDVHGNAAEWVEDCHFSNYEGAPADGSAWVEFLCPYRVLRGGSWYSTINLLRSAKRQSFPPIIRFGHLGFRVARTL